MKYKITKKEIHWNVRQFIDKYIMDRCKEISMRYKKHPDLNGFFNHVLDSHYKNIESLTIEELLSDDILICIKYIDNKKPARVYFVPMMDYPTYHDALVDKYFLERKNILRDLWNRKDLIKSIEC